MNDPKIMRKKLVENVIKPVFQRLPPATLLEVDFKGAELKSPMLCQSLDPRQCCERDHNFDGNCDRHPNGLTFEELAGATIVLVRQLTPTLCDEDQRKFAEACRNHRGPCFCGFHVTDVID